MPSPLWQYGLAALAAALLAPAHAACPRPDDFLSRADPGLAPVRPHPCSVVAQTPPEFSWPPVEGAQRYELALTLPGGRVEKRTTERNWLLWDRPLPEGRYAWSVTAEGPGGSSKPRTFTVAPGAVPLVVPEEAALLRRARETARPRTWPQGDASPLAAFKGERAAGFRALLSEVDGKRSTPVQPEPSSGSVNGNYEETAAEQKRTLAAALAWAATKDRRYGDDAARRLMAQARWNTDGTLAHATNDMGNRTVAWTLALGYDWMHDYLDEAQKDAIADAIRARVAPLHADLMAKLGAHPYDSHANVSLSILAAIGALMAGEIHEADRWLADALPMTVAWTSPWGWQDGGFGNGTAQAFWDAGSHLPAWYVLRTATGVDLARKEWVRNFPRFLAYFVPPGAPGGAFGDGREMHTPEVWSRIARALAQFAPSPLAGWYAASQRGEDAARVEVLLAPRGETRSGGLPPGTPHAAVFPSIGWVAMHSRLDDPRRTSIYFKSSPYGSHNHSHADQNSFVIDHAGERLAIASGYYDGYRTPHWTGWYKQTRAANAITFDGGQGQGVDDRRFSGEIAQFATTERYDVAVGHAERAYDGALAAARRAIVHLRPGVVLVHDRLASATPRTWEWNLHALREMQPQGPRAVTVRNGAARMCVEMIASPPVAFSQHDRFAAPPRGQGEAQWHGVFASAAPSQKAEFVALLRIGEDCRAATRRTPAKVERDGGVLRVRVDGSTVRFGETVEVTPGRSPREPEERAERSPAAPPPRVSLRRGAG